MRPSVRPASQLGLTALELLASLAIAGIVLAGAVPGFRHLVLEARMTAAVNAMVRDLHLARQAANLRGETVTVCPAAPGNPCGDGGNWQAGWSVYAGLPGTADQPPRVLASSAPGPGIRVLSNRANYAFRPFTRRDTNGTLGFCDARGPAAVRALVVSPTGKPRLASRAEARARIKC